MGLQTKTAGPAIATNRPPVSAAPRGSLAELSLSAVTPRLLPMAATAAPQSAAAPQILPSAIPPKLLPMAAPTQLALAATIEIRVLAPSPSAIPLMLLPMAAREPPA